MCTKGGCKVRPSFNIEGETKALYCSKHKIDGMVDVISKICLNSWCRTHVGNKYDGYCLFCFVHMFPGKPVSRNYKTKEFEVVSFVKNTFQEVTWRADKKVEGGCSRRRPDILVDLGYQVVIIEVDENQHIGYDCSCENKRIMELSKDVDHRPIVFIRFNPDDYLVAGVNQSSCFHINSKGFCAVKKSKQNEWRSRLLSLQETIQYWLQPCHRTEKLVEIVELFFDR